MVVVRDGRVENVFDAMIVERIFMSSRVKSVRIIIKIQRIVITLRCNWRCHYHRRVFIIQIMTKQPIETKTQKTRERIANRAYLQTVVPVP